MSDKKKVKEEKIEDVKVESENNAGFDANKIDFESLDDKQKLDAWNKLKEQNLMLITIVRECEKHMTELEEKAKGKVSDDAYKRLMADYENFKRRNEKARAESYFDGKFEVIESMLEIIDTLERAISMIKDESVAEGVKMVQAKFEEKLKKFGVEEIDAKNQAFDPNLHNCVMQGEAQNENDVDKVVEVFQKGYKMGDKVLRYSFVKVAK